ncbi:unnamed protein product [Adineta steineri]|uniref:Uncharacterized protein n=1 Tax=Adineta steineri TaxID=433720 RepID=A0A819APD2_9BILA|nr:unnamed protein product [Adineta steineri]
MMVEISIQRNLVPFRKVQILSVKTRTVLFTLGEVFIPGSDPTYFWRPTNVADGYCNSRIIKLYSKGKFLEEYTMPDEEKQLSIPHKLFVLMMEKEMKTVYTFTYYANKHRLYAVNGKSGKNRAVGFTFDAHPESFALSVGGHALFVGEIRPNRIDVFDVFT